MASITRIITRPERLRRDQADQVKSAVEIVVSQKNLPLDVVSGLYKYVERNTASKGRWTFVMLSPEQNSIVVDYLAENSSRPIVAIRLWALCFKHLCMDTGEILLRRDEIAKELEQSSENVSRIMTELETCGAIIRKRQKQGGMKGPGVVCYFMNPNVATHLAGAERDAAQRATPPLLVLMQGGKADASAAAIPPT